MPVKHEKINYSLTVRRSIGPARGIDHWHQRAGFIYVLEGECWIKASKQERICGPRDLAVFRSGEIHALFGGGDFLVYIFTFDPAMFSHFLPESRFPRSFISAEEQKTAGLDGEITGLFHQIYQEKINQEPLHEALIRADILRLYSFLVLHFEDDSPRDEKSLARLQQFQAALEFIADHYAEHITLAWYQVHM